MLTDAQRTDIRRYCGYPLYGTGSNTGILDRFFTHYRTLEYRCDAMSATEVAVVVKKLTTLNQLEDAVTGTTDNLDTASAGPWVHNTRETRDRIELYTFHRTQLCAFFGIPAGPHLATGGLSLVV